MTLSEELESTINDASKLDELKAGCYGMDNRPCWIGAYRPATTCAELTGLANWAATHYAYYLNFVREFMDKRGDILDIGCGCGQNTAMLARYGNAIGVDPESFGIGFAKKYNAGSGAQFMQSGFPCEMPHQFDYIFCVETIEHVNHGVQATFINAALAMLRPDGMMFITTPNETSASGPHHGIWAPDHLKLMEDGFGCRIVKRGYFSNVRPGDGFVEGGTHHAWVLQ